MTLSPRMLAVLRWLAAWPTVYVTQSSDDGYPMWSATWANEAARRHMIATCGKLGLDVSRHEARWPGTVGETPRLHLATWRALRQRGLVRAFAQEVRPNGTRGRLRYQLSPEGRLALLAAGRVGGRP